MLVNFYSRNNTFPEVLGISEERADELQENLKKSFISVFHDKEKDKLSDILELALEMCDDINEISYVSFLCGRQIGVMEKKKSELSNDEEGD